MLSGELIENGDVVLYQVMDPLDDGEIAHSFFQRESLRRTSLLGIFLVAL